MKPAIPSISLVNILAKEKLLSISAALSKPNIPSTQATAPFNISRGPKINELNKPLTAPAIPPMIPPSANPANAPLIVSNKVIIINSGKNTLEATLATAPTAEPNLAIALPILLKKPLILLKIPTLLLTDVTVDFNILPNSTKGLNKTVKPFIKVFSD